MKEFIILIINDIHIGFNRKGGVTPASAEALRTYLFRGLRELLESTDESHLCVLGDLFDQFDVSERDWLEAYAIFSKWLTAGNVLTLIAGNHDQSPKAMRVSSFEMLACVLREQHGKSVEVVRIDQYAVIDEHVIALAHCSNQETFNAQLEAILQLAGDEPWDQYEAIHSYLLLHANYHKGYCANSDHSLNVSEEMARRFIDKGINLVFAHEHQARREMPLGSSETGAEVIVLGNQWPTSVADCLGNDAKYAHVLRAGKLTRVQTWSKDDGAVGFVCLDWQDLTRHLGLGPNGFIRVVGEATSSQAAEVINAIAAFRSLSSAFVITNAVKIDGIAAAEELPESFEAAKKFDVLEFMRKQLEQHEVELMDSLLKETA